MDAVDLNWCLACGCRIELDGSTPYCSQNCLNSDSPSTSSHPSHHNLPSLVDRDAFHYEDDDDDYPYDDRFPDPQSSSPIRNAWIGRGDDGIRAWAQAIPRGAPCGSAETASGTLKPKLLLQTRRPLKPSLCMSRAQPAPPEPSRPIRTPQQSLPSFVRDSTSIPSTSVVSLTTGSSYSVVTPATTSEIGSFRDPALPRSTAQQINFLGGLKAQLRAWATSSTSQKEAPRSSTLTRNRAVHVADDSDAESAIGHDAPKVRRPRSPAPFFHMPEQYPQEKAPRDAAKENAHSRDHPAYRMRGRKAFRIAS